MFYAVICGLPGSVVEPVGKISDCILLVLVQPRPLCRLWTLFDKNPMNRWVNRCHDD